MSTGLTTSNESGGMLEKRKKVSLYHSIYRTGKHISSSFFFENFPLFVRDVFMYADITENIVAKKLIIIYLSK